MSDAVVAGRLVANPPLDNHPAPADGQAREAAGSSRLSAAQADWYEQHYHDRYTVVPDRPPQAPNRKARRLTKRRKRVAE